MTWIIVNIVCSIPIVAGVVALGAWAIGADSEEKRRRGSIGEEIASAAMREMASAPHPPASTPVGVQQRHSPARMATQGRARRSEVAGSTR
jgi:hypothetical protein